MYSRNLSKMNIKNLTKNHVIHCPTPELYDEVLSICQKNGYFNNHDRWKDRWEGKKSNTCLRPLVNKFGSINIAYEEDKFIKIKAQDFIDANFVLPKYWAVKSNSNNHLTIGKYYDTQGKYNIYNNIEYGNKYFHSHNLGICGNTAGFPIMRGYAGSNFTRDFVKEGYTEITFNQFKKYVMKETKKIIGYKAPYDLFNGCIKQGTVYTKVDGNAANGAYWCNSDSTSTIPKEIVEQWEAVYKEELKVGDWAYFMGNDPENTTSYWTKGIIGKVRHIDRSLKEAPCVLVALEDRNATNDFEEFRKATPEEIQKHLNSLKQKVTVNQANGDSFILVVNKDGIRYGGQWLNISELKDLFNMDSLSHGSKTNTSQGTWDVTYKTVDIGCKRDIMVSDLQACISIYDKFQL